MLFWLYGGHYKNETPHKSITNCKNKTIVTKLIKYMLVGYEFSIIKKLKSENPH